MDKAKNRGFFDCIPYDGLICMIQNVPTGKIFSELGIDRQDTRDLHVEFEIYEKITGKRLFLVPNLEI